MEFNATFLVTIISFVIFVFLMNIILYQPILNIVAKRKEFIDGSLSDAKDFEKRSVELDKQRTDTLNGAKNEAKSVYVNSIETFKQKKDVLLKEAQENASKEVNDSFANLQNVSNEAKESLKGHMTDLANDIVEKVLGYRSEVQGFDSDAVNNILYHGKG